MGFIYLFIYFSSWLCCPLRFQDLPQTSVRVFPGLWRLLSFLRHPSWDGSPSLPLLSLFLSFIFCPTSFRRQWAAFLGAWCPPPAFRSCFVEFAQRSNVLSVNLWGRKWSPHPIPPPFRTTLPGNLILPAPFFFLSYCFGYPESLCLNKNFKIFSF